MNEQNQQIVDGAKQYSNYITKNIPQTEKEGPVKYYFSGSLAMLLLNSARQIKPMVLDEKGNIIYQSQNVNIGPQNIEKLNQGIRPVGLDIDVVTIDESAFNGQARTFNLYTVKDNCDLATNLCPKWERIGGTLYFDWLADERVIVAHNVAEVTLNDNSKVYIADPLCMMFHKLADAIVCKKKLESGTLSYESQKKMEAKYQKDINDFTALYNGVIDLYPNADISQVMDQIIKNNPYTAFTRVFYSNSTTAIKMFYYDAKDKIPSDKQKGFYEFMNTVGVKNKEILKKQDVIDIN